MKEKRKKQHGVGERVNQGMRGRKGNAGEQMRGMDKGKEEMEKRE